MTGSTSARISSTHIKSDAARAVTFSKRKKGLLKKGRELSILCGVEVAVMCHHPQVGGATSPLTWANPDIDSVIARYKTVAPEERERRKLDNTSLLQTQVQKLVADLHHMMDQNRKLANHLEQALWDDRLNTYGAADLQEVAGQVLCKKQEVADRLAKMGTQQELNQNTCWGLAQSGPYPDVNVDSCATSEQQKQQLRCQIPGQPDKITLSSTLLQQVMSSLPFPCTHEMAAAFLNLQAAYTTQPLASNNPMNFLTPPARCNTVTATGSPSSMTIDKDPAESANSVVVGHEDQHDPQTPTSDLALLDHTFTNGVMNHVGTLDDYGPLSISSDMAPVWYCNPVATCTEIDDLDVRAADACCASQKMNFSSEIFDLWQDGVNSCAPNVTGFQLGGCQPNPLLQSELGILPQQYVM